MSLVRAENLTKTYRMGDVEVQALKGVDFSIDPSSFVAFVGPSGSGKSTLYTKYTKTSNIRQSSQGRQPAMKLP